MNYIITEYLYVDDFSSKATLKWALLKSDHLKGGLSPVIFAETKELLYTEIEKRFEVDLLQTRKTQLESKISPVILEALKEVESDNRTEKSKKEEEDV